VVRIAVENRCFVRDAWIRHGVDWLDGHNVMQHLLASLFKYLKCLARGIDVLSRRQASVVSTVMALC
jgi:hypothetical protein